MNNIYIVYHIGSYDPKCVIIANSFEEAMQIRGWKIEGDMSRFTVPDTFRNHRFYCLEFPLTYRYWDI